MFGSQHQCICWLGEQYQHHSISCIMYFSLLGELLFFVALLILIFFCTSSSMMQVKMSGGWFNIKMPSYQYRTPHCGDKMILQPSYINNVISYTGNQAQVLEISVCKSIYSVPTYCLVCLHLPLNSSPPGQNGHYFGRWHFQMNFLEWKWQNLNSNFIEICSQESNWQ